VGLLEDQEFGTVVLVVPCLKKRGIQLSESKNNRNVYLPEFKAKVNPEALGGMRTIKQVTRDLVLNISFPPNLLTD
jgi:hypothetical protein